MELKLKKKVILIMAIFGLVALVIVGRLAHIILIEGDDLRAAVELQKQYEYLNQYERGTILDTNGDILVKTEFQYHIGFNINRLSQESINKKLDAIVELTDFKMDYLLETLANNKDGGMVYFGYITDELVANKLKWVHGVSTDKHPVRLYPYGDLASQILGRTKKEDIKNELDGNYLFFLDGKSGIEDLFDAELKGEDGYFFSQTDRWKRDLLNGDRKEKPVQDGENIQLTIDAVIQGYLEEALKETYEYEEAISAQGLVLNVKTGEIIAMGSYPGIEMTSNIPNTLTVEEKQKMIDQGKWEDYNVIYNQALRNRPIQDTIELGSIMKLVTTAIALEGDYYTPESYFDEGNIIFIGKHGIKCWRYPQAHPPGSLTQAVADSCNPVFVRMTLEMGPEVLWDGFDKMGLFDYSGIDLPGEALFVHAANDTSLVKYANMSFGQGVAYNQLEGAMAIAALVNGGNLLEPQIIKQITTPDGLMVDSMMTTVKRKVVSEITSQQMRDIMEFVVDSGAGGPVKTPGLRVGGKSGSSQKWVPGEVVDGEYIAGHYSTEDIYGSFLSVFPMEDPTYMVYVIVDEPRTGTNGTRVAGPPVKAIMDKMITYYAIPTEIDENRESVLVPDLIGMTFQEARILLDELGLTYNEQDPLISESALIVTNQYPHAGKVIKVGDKIIIETHQ